LVVDTVGFNDKTRVDTEGHPHTGALMAYEVAITDPGAYTKLWKIPEYSPSAPIGN
jgi:hypothetical protein